MDVISGMETLIKNYCNKYWTLDELCKIEYGSSYYDHELNEYNFEVWTIEKFIEK